MLRSFSRSKALHCAGSKVNKFLEKKYLSYVNFVNKNKNQKIIKKKIINSKGR